MSKRLQVLIDPKEYKKLLAAARYSGVSLGEWVRQSLRRSLSTQTITPGEEKLRVVRQLSHRHSFPSGDIDDMIKDIEKGRR